MIRNSDISIFPSMMSRFKSVLVANRGEIASRILRTANKLGYRTIAVYTDADESSPHIATADERVNIGKGPVLTSYLSIEKILDAAIQTGAESIHPGYGFLSENAEFADAVKTAGLVFIGPDSKAISIMGSKSESKRKMIEVGVPCIPGYQGLDQVVKILEDQAQKIGFPVMVKASAGGGGRGMRLVESSDQFDDSVKLAKAEAASSFGSSELIIEKAFVDARHIEVQIMADSHGNILHLGERDCSIQRRHQKVIEESPSPIVTQPLRDQMGKAAIKAAKAVDYEGAGTIEFLVDGDKNFFFLEMNTRIQVEHPVTEMVTGIDLIALQLLVAQGEPLPINQSEIKLDGHAIEARLYAEDPSKNFLPGAGKIDYWSVPSIKGVRIDGGIKSGQTISTFYDPMLAKIIGYGENREVARKNLLSALQKTALFGINNNKKFLSQCLEKPSFVQGDFNTSFIASEFRDQTSFESQPTFIEASIAASIQIVLERGNLLSKTLVISDPLLNWTNANNLRFRKIYDFDNRIFDLCISPINKDHNRFTVTDLSTEEEVTIRLRDLGNNLAQCIYENELIEISYYDVKPGHLYCSIGFSTNMFVDAITNYRGENSLVKGDKVIAPMHGELLQLDSKVGDKISKDQVVAILDAMKMHYEIKVEVDGIITAIHFKKGDQVAADDILIEIKV